MIRRHRDLLTYKLVRKSPPGPHISTPVEKDSPPVKYLPLLLKLTTLISWDPLPIKWSVKKRKFKAALVKRNWKKGAQTSRWKNSHSKASKIHLVRSLILPIAINPCDNLVPRGQIEFHRISTVKSIWSLVPATKICQNTGKFGLGIKTR